MYNLIILISIISVNANLLVLRGDSTRDSASQLQLCTLINKTCIKPINITFHQPIAFSSFYMDRSNNNYILTVHEKNNVTIQIFDNHHNLIYYKSLHFVLNTVFNIHNGLNVFGFSMDLKNINTGETLYYFIHCFPFKTYDFYDNNYYISLDDCRSTNEKHIIYIMNVITNIVQKYPVGFQPITMKYNPIDKLLYIFAFEESINPIVKLLTFDYKTNEIKYITQISALSIIACGWNNDYTLLFCSMCEYICPSNGPIILFNHIISTNTTSYDWCPYYIWAVA